MKKKLTAQERYVREELSKLYPQLEINCQKTLGAAYNKHGHDLLSVCIEFFLNKPIEVQVKSFKEGKAENFITFMMGMQSKSSTSRFYHIYRKHNEKSRDYYTDGYQYDIDKHEKYEEDDLMYCIKAQMKHLDPFEKMLIEERVMRKRRFVDIAEQYDIPYTALANQLKKTLKTIKEKCSHLR